MRWMIGLVILVTFMVIGLVSGYLGGPEFLSGDFQSRGPQFVALAAMGIVILMGVFVRKPAVREVLGAIVFWGGLGLLLLIGYSYRYELMTVRDRVMSELFPGTLSQTASGDLVLSRGNNRQFHIAATIDGAPVSMLVDTGASHITLSYADAQQVGLQPDRLSFNTPVQTANGMGFVARVRLQELDIGAWQLHDLPAFVAQDGMLPTSLLGMSALNKFASWRVEGNQLILSPR